MSGHTHWFWWKTKSSQRLLFSPEIDPAKVPTEFVQVDKLILQFTGEHRVKNSQDVTEEAEDVGTWEMQCSKLP